MLVAATVAGCAARAPSTPRFPGSLPPSVAGDRTGARLSDSLDEALLAPALRGVLWGVEVRSLDRDEQLYNRNPHVLMMPASAMKIVTLAVAVHHLGWDDRFETRLLSRGRVDDGVLHGDLVIRGSGDPTLDDEVLRSWARELRARGVHRITGRIIGDDRLMLGGGETHGAAAVGFGAGWSWDDLALGFAAPVGPLQYRENVIEIRVEPGGAAGSPASASIQTPGSALRLDNQVSTTARDEPSLVLLRRAPGDQTLVVAGHIAAGADAILRAASVDNPTRFLVHALRAALEQHGVAVGGPAVDIDEIPAGELTSTNHGVQTLIHHQSAPLSTIAVTMMKRSQNMFAESMLLRLGVVLRSDARAGSSVVAETLAEWGIGRNRAIVADGSGLSRYNYLTVTALADVLTRVHERQGDHTYFSAALPVAGRDGTLENRLTGTAAEGNARAKTGSMSQVRSLAGLVRTADGEQLVFAVIANNFGVDAADVTDAIDATIATLATLSRPLAP